MKEEKKYIDSYDKLTIGKYMELNEVIEDKEASDTDKNIAITSILTGMDEVDLYNLPLSDFNALYQNALFLTEKPMTRKVCDKYNLGHFKLEVQFNLEDMTTAQFIDYQTFIKEPEKNLVEILSIFLIPDGKKGYNQGYSVVEVQDTIREKMCILDAISLSAFFLTWCKALLKATLTSFRRQMKKLKKDKRVDQEKMKELEKQVALLEKDGAGLLW